jgi:uncharacterized protein (DUF952 family)
MVSPAKDLSTAPTVTMSSWRWETGITGTILNLVLEVDLARVAAPVVYDDDERRFPHIYGPLERHAVRRIHRVERAADGTFIAIGEPAPDHLS